MAALMSLVAAYPATASDDILRSLRWQARVLLVFAPGPDDPDLLRQHALLAPHAGESDERDLVRIDIIGNEVSGTLPGPAAPDARTLRQRFDVNPARFAVVLVGKDGGVKLRDAQPVDACELHGLIDRMPMRRREAGNPAAPSGCGGPSAR